MKSFEDFQISAWVSEGLILQSVDRIADVVRVAKVRAEKFLLGSAIAVVSTCTFAMPSYGVGSAVGGSPNVVQMSSPKVPMRSIDKEIATVEDQLANLRAKLSARSFSGIADSQLLVLATQARAKSQARPEQVVKDWAEALVKSQFA